MNQRTIKMLRKFCQSLDIHQSLGNLTQKRDYLSGVARLAYPRVTPLKGYADMPVSGEVIDEIALHADMLTIGEDLRQVLDTVTSEHNKKDQSKTRRVKT